MSAGQTRSAGREAALAAAAGLLLGCSFPPFTTGALALIGFVPLFIALENAETYRRTLTLSYLAFFVFGLVTLYWPGGFVHGRDGYLMAAGALLLVAHPLFFCIPMLVWTYCRRHLGFKAAMAAFPAVWVAFEYAHSSTELAFPWLLLGYTQSYDLAAVQIASVAGTYGLSFWITLFNVGAYVLYAKVALGEWKLGSGRAIGYSALLVMLYLAPKVYGWSVVVPEESSRRVRIDVVQPDIDPFEKWRGASDPQLAALLDMTREAAADSPDLVLWPETAVPFYILDPANRSWLDLLGQRVRQMRLNLLTGMPDIVYAPGGAPPPAGSKTSSRGAHYTTYNGAMLLRPDADTIQRYGKIKLVPFAERVPYSTELEFLNAMNWNFGLGGWNIGSEKTVFLGRARDGSEFRFANMICFESVYPGFVADFVRRGAEFITVITNDSWWGKTSGIIQHRQIAVFRAVENRRWVVQCANGGISCFIDPEGHILQESDIFVRQRLSGTVMPRRTLSYYTQHPDWPALICGFLTLFVVTAAAGQTFYHRVRRSQNHD